ncbi:MAG: glycolate oxidase subunit GlcF [Candidatus Thiodiazotropha sp. (ex Ctena orbiculata)]|uniref:Glycolate oxidase iron-sulfur subunit n=1 Tax=Candidatus Thiodiazotropha taylori TaxID=2792791 RepID=A0A944M6D6_9GAMM|nr:glycolate oxidase subunit GlcF [Candidatus Thiodiazotropha taylori]MBV2137688.1 glycolate oxidase subunit GlcF [Candidatus Thiodiazotropha taylori]
MQTSFSAQQLSMPAIASSDVELRACLQCDYCTPNCPTFQLLGDEYDSSRGRVYLIKELLESEGRPDRKTVEYLDRCLSCLACMSTCPSSVHYQHLLDHAREAIEQRHRRKPLDRLSRWMLAKLLPHPKRFRFAMHAARMLKPAASSLPDPIRGMVEYMPDSLPPPSPNDLPQVFPAQGERRRRVVLLTGCAQQALNTDINDATIRILSRHGCEVVVPAGAGCCGAVTHHMGKTKESLAAAARNIRVWMKEMDGEGLDAIAINTSGCGTVVKDYGYMFRNDPLARQASKISAMAKDITELLAEMDLDYRVKPGLRISYHATCSLQFGQRIRFTPRKLLKAAGFIVLEPRDSHTCCGAAGTYNLLQPEISSRLKASKLKELEAGLPAAIAAGNIGCIMHLTSASRIPVVHTVELLDWVTGGPIPKSLNGICSETG